MQGIMVVAGNISSSVCLQNQIARGRDAATSTTFCVVYVSTCAALWILLRGQPPQHVEGIGSSLPAAASGLSILGHAGEVSQHIISVRRIEPCPGRGLPARPTPTRAGDFAYRQEA